MRSLATALVIVAAIAGTGVNAMGASESDLTVSLRVAARTWHTQPLAADRVITEPSLAGGILGQADIQGQTIELAADWRDWDPAYLCTIVVHEVGHLVGQKHSADPDNVMYPVISRIYWRCDRAFGWRLHYRQPRPDGAPVGARR